MKTKCLVFRSITPSTSLLKVKSIVGQQMKKIVLNKAKENDQLIIQFITKLILKLIRGATIDRRSGRSVRLKIKTNRFKTSYDLISTMERRIFNRIDMSIFPMLKHRFPIEFDRFLFIHWSTFRQLKKIFFEIDRKV